MAVFTKNWKDSLVGHSYQLRLIIEQLSQNIADNTTTFSWRLEAKHNSAYTGVWMNGNAGAWSVRSPDTTIMDSGTQQGYDFRTPGRTLVIASGTVTHPHNSDGTYVRSWRADWAANGSLAPGTFVTGTIYARTIPRATTPNWSGNFTTGTAKTINLPYAATTFSHDVTYEYGTYSGTIASGATNTASWTPPHSLFNQTSTRNLTAATGTIKVVTKSGSTVIGTVTKSFTLNLATSQIPTVTSVTWHEQNPIIASNIGAFVQGLSLVKGTVAATGILGSPISSRALTIAGQTYTESDIVSIGSSGTITATGRAADTRGRLGTRAANFTVLPWSPPAIPTFLVRRANTNGTLNDSGTSLRLTLNATISSLIVSGSQKNSLRIEVFTRRTGVTAWSTRNVITAALSYDSSVNISGGGIYPVDQSFEVMVKVSDKTGIDPTEAVTLIPTSAVTMHWKGTGVGIGKYWERGAVDVGGQIYQNGSAVVDVSDPMPRRLATDWDTTTSPGLYAASASAPGSPISGVGFMGLIMSNSGNTYLTQILTPASTGTSSGAIFTRYISAAGVPQAWRTIPRVGMDGTPYAMAAGRAPTSATGNYTNISFPTGRFTQPPIVTVTVVSAGGDGTGDSVAVPWTGTISATSFTLAAFTLGGARVASRVEWTAVQMTSETAVG